LEHPECQQKPTKYLPKSKKNTKINKTKKRPNIDHGKRKNKQTTIEKHRDQQQSTNQLPKSTKQNVGKQISSAQINRTSTKINVQTLKIKQRQQTSTNNPLTAKQKKKQLLIFADDVWPVADFLCSSIGCWRW